VPRIRNAVRTVKEIYTGDLYSPGLDNGVGADQAEQDDRGKRDLVGENVGLVLDEHRAA